MVLWRVWSVGLLRAGSGPSGIKVSGVVWVSLNLLFRCEGKEISKDK